MAEIIDLHERNRWRAEFDGRLHALHNALKTSAPNHREVKWMAVELHYREYQRRCGEQLQLPFDGESP